MEGFNIAVVGATEIVGQEIIKVLEQRKFPVASIRLLAPEYSSGMKILFNHKRIEVREAQPGAFRDVDIALFSADADVSRRLSPLAVGAGAVVIDNSSAFRMNPTVPLVVPEVNPGDIEWHKGIIASPNCSTIQMVVALYPLHKINPIKRIVVSTYESVSSSGGAALREVTNQARLVLEGRRICPHVYSHQIAFNVLPEIGVFLDNGYTKEEQQMMEETRKTLHTEDIAISATCVRVPVYFGHSEAVNVEFNSPITPEEARKILAQAPGVRVLDDPTVSFYPQPWAASGSDHVFVGRIRKDISHLDGLVMWIVADNLRKGGALNVVQIAEEGIGRGWISLKESLAS
ncbi:MAG: aspartate-semialdehyde dehydrogenase [Dehalococcoidia bacterium]|nr:MAG: aspartate-semialdehyde dehydrogenase [Dehalococcoidia bacterium]TEU16666.1 MAG: aspartate-semialdehyde dehydrogenase [Dehalococcoidia bacterium]